MLQLRDTDALLIIDVQRDFLPGGALAVPAGDEVVPVLSDCIQAFIHRGLPVVASRDWHPPGHCSFSAAGGMWPPHCVAGTPGAAIDPGLKLPAGAKIVDKARATDKDSFSAFEDTDLDPWLKQQGVRRIFAGGLATEYCVFNSVRDALRHGYDLVLLADAIRAIDPAAGDKAVQILRREHATIAESSDIQDVQS